MEVHAHTHTARKKWTHYFWEFLMLFLAVFCGFLAENQREHMVEHHREKQYMQSMLDDLKQDTAEIGNKLYEIDSTLLPMQNSSLNNLYLDKFTDSIIRSIHEVVPVAIKSFTFSFQNRTTLQLKNSGSLRLIRNKEITDSLADYWYLCNHLENVLLAGYQDTRTSAKEIVFSLFNFDNYSEKNPWLPLVETRQLQFLSADQSQFKKLGNYISNMRGQLSGPFKYVLQDAHQKAVDLIKLIQRKYHIK